MFVAVHLWEALGLKCNLPLLLDFIIYNYRCSAVVHHTLLPHRSLLPVNGLIYLAFLLVHRRVRPVSGPESGSGLAGGNCNLELDIRYEPRVNEIVREIFVEFSQPVFTCHRPRAMPMESLAHHFPPPAQSSKFNLKILLPVYTARLVRPPTLTYTLFFISVEFKHISLKNAKYLLVMCVWPMQTFHHLIPPRPFILFVCANM